MQDADRGMSLRDYVAPIIARVWLILAVVILTTTATYAYYAQQPKVYEASTKLYVAAEANPVLGVGAGFSDDRTVENQATLLRSTGVAALVARRIGYKGDPRALAGRVQATPSEGSDFILVSARDGSPGQAAAIANGFAQSFIDLRSQTRRAGIAKAIDQLRKQQLTIPPGRIGAEERSNVTAQIRQLKFAQSTPAGNATQVDPAAAPRSPAAPKPARNTLFGFALALLGSIFLAYFLERFDPRLRTVDEAAAIYARPILASIVHDEDVVHFSDGMPAISPVSREAFRQLRIQLQLDDPDGSLRTVLVTSASSAEGKSTVTRNLGLALHEAGRRVALVDADLRKPTLAKLLAAKPKAGFMDALTTDLRLDDILTLVAVQSRGVDDLERMAAPNGAHGDMTSEARGAITLIAAGPEPANPPAALESAASRKLLAEIAERYDIVLIDTPPLLEVSDAIPLLAEVDAVVLVVRPDATQRRSAERVMQTITRVPGMNFLGLVANDLTGLEASDYGGRYGYKYGAADGKKGKDGSRGDTETSLVAPSGATSA